jgi:hypothetical protein
MSEHNQDAERVDKPTMPQRDNSVEKLASVANIGLVGVPVAYMTSQSIVITLIAVALAITGVVAYMLVQRRR